MKRLIIIAAMLVMSGCGNMGAAMNDAMFPNTSVRTNDFDNSTIAHQPPVVASRPTLTSDDTAQMLGFEWVSSTPDIIYITAGIDGILNIYTVDLLADDQNIQGISLASNSTEFQKGGSSRRFAMPLDEFRKIVSARIVKMKITRNNDYSVSRFGQEYPDVAVTGKITKFMAKVDDLRMAQGVK
jgi:hypothetical protein